MASTIVLMSYDGGQLRADIVVQGRSGEMGAGGRISGWVVDMGHNLGTEDVRILTVPLQS